MPDKGGNRQQRQRKERAVPPKAAAPKKKAVAATPKRRPRHTDGDWEALLRDAEERGFVITKGQNYFKAKCGCAEKKWVSVQLTASSSRSLINKRKQFERCDCWHRPETGEGEGNAG